ncbi:uncharacterized protein H6S33_002670 [Morchella sextelata]|uniref:uncharacterized protein n=1 Tax=Morchella sextelata TaxID=1174677 RepID=UPI001D050080|nr:uncharacterized protein H6S33_002670 [Morchella sextelata]KAH0607636.1 hypothetical protein H6S33_002670 [Morchella sextelata]
MPRPVKTSTTRLPRELVQELGLDNPANSRRKGGKNKRLPDRKERRRQERDVKKKQRIHFANHGPPQPIHSQAGADDDSDDDEEEAPPVAKEAKPKKKKEEEEKPKSILKKTKRPETRAAVEEKDETSSSRPHIRRAVKDKLAEDDAEISALEKKLKIKSKKLPASFQEDGLDFLMEGLDEDFLAEREGGAKRRKTAKAVPEPEPEEMDISDEESGEEDEEDRLDDILDGMDLDEDDEDPSEDEDDIPEDDEDDEDEEEFMGIKDDEPSSEKPIDSPAATPSTTEAPKFAASTSKYIPPSLRGAPTTDSELLQRLQRTCKGLINRLSEANLLPILGEIEALYRSNPRAHVTATLSDLLITIVCDPSSLMDTFMILHAGLVAGLYKLIGTDFGAHIVQRIVENFDVHYQKTNGIENPASGTKECTNLMSFLAELYNFQVVGCGLMFDLIRIFLGEITELNTELLLKIVRNSGTQLRQDDPTALKDLVVMMQPAINKIGTANMSVRTKFMIETLTNLKNNRLKSTTATSAVTSQSTSRMRKILGSLNTRHLRATEPLRASLDDIRNTETKGKWWLVGASWIGNQASAETAPAETTTTTPSSSSSSSSSKPTKKTKKPDSEFGTITDLVELARQQRMNTDVRRSIFVTIMSAEDYTDAHNRLLKLRLKRKQEPEIPRVLVHCCGSEASYNPYYTLIARKLCGQRSLKMTFTFCLWDIFRRMGEDDGGRAAAGEAFDDEEEGDEGLRMRRTVNWARMYGSLIAEGALGLDVLKTLNMAYLQSRTRTFLELLFINVVLHSQRNAVAAAAAGQGGRDEKAVMDVFMRIAENVDLARSVLYFLRKYVKGTDVAGEEAETATVRWGVGVACAGLKAIVARDTVGK